MDLSKLPKLSDTQKHAPQPAPAQEQAMPGGADPTQQAPVLGYDPRLEGGGFSMQIWISLIIGFLLMMMGWQFAKYAAATLTGQAFDTGIHWTIGPKAGQPVSYFELQGYVAYTETGEFLFGLALVLEAAVLAFVKRNTASGRALVALTFGLSAFVTGGNLVLALVLFGKGITPMTSMLIVAFGGWTAMTQWQILKQMRATARAYSY